MTQVNISPSFIQSNKHVSKSTKFVHLTPSDIGQVLSDSGFELVHLKSGRARKLENEAHQTTIARYRHANALSIQSGGRDMYMDLVFKVPHLYGALEAFVGTFRQICSNGLTVGSKFIVGRIPHVGDATSQLNALIPSLVASHDQLVDSIREMQARNVTPDQVADFVREAARIRLGQLGLDSSGQGISSVQFTDLTRVRRAEDSQNDAFSVLNVVQENLSRYGLRYILQSNNENGVPNAPRNMTARPISYTVRQGDTESVRSVDVNAQLWDAAERILLKQAA